MRLRIGRQELSYGQERILGTREGANTRQSFDGLRFTVKLKKITGDFFAVYPVEYEYGVFDNWTNTGNLVYSTYWNIPLHQNNMLDLYYIGNNHNSVSIRNDTASEYRGSFGIRLSKSTGSLYYDAEAIWQTGSYGKLLIRGWQFSAFAGYRWRDLRMSPRIQIRVTTASGDRDSTDRQINLFRPVFTRSPINDLIPIGLGNIAVFSPEGEIRIADGTLFDVHYYAIRRLSKNDGFYVPDMQEVLREPDKKGVEQGKQMTHGFTAEINFTLNKHFAILILEGYFVPGDYVMNTGMGLNQEALMLKATYRF
jgi:hypothetical protein